MTLPQGFFIVLWISVFFLISVWCSQVALSKTRNEVKTKQGWWGIMQWWYGVGFMIFVVLSIFFSFIFWMVIKFLGNG